MLNKDTSKDKSRERGSGVWVVEGGKPKRIKVVTGISDGIFTELVSGDVIDGQEVIVEAVSKPKGQQSSNPPRMF
ncbi:MAG: efflux transporter, family, subunit [Deltaproteobacteria bacterium]|nr:efflux transporter, family, subunit [Deltaproteobacteria bacterium]